MFGMAGQQSTGLQFLRVGIDKKQQMKNTKDPQINLRGRILTVKIAH
jgi:hypothetical protein